MVIRFALMVFTAVGILAATTLLLIFCVAFHFNPNAELLAEYIILIMGFGYALAYKRGNEPIESITCFFVGVGGCLLLLASWRMSAFSLPILFGATFWLAGVVGSNISADMWLTKRRTLAH